MVRHILSTWPDAADPFQERPADHDALNFAYAKGMVRDDNTVADVAQGTVTLTDDATNYIEVTGAGTVSANTTGFTAGRIPLYEVVTAAAAIDTVTDRRTAFMPPGAGGDSGASDVVLIDEREVGAGGAASVTFDPIPDIYRHLLIRCIARSDRTGSNLDGLLWALNSDTTDGNYNRHWWQAFGSTISAGVGTGDRIVMWAPTGDVAAGMFVQSSIEVDHYRGPQNKVGRMQSAGYDSNYRREIYNSHWSSTAAITAITFTLQNSNLVEGSLFSLYGYS